MLEIIKVYKYFIIFFFFNYQFQYDVEKLDPRGRSPLLLAVTLGHLESTRVLLKANANVNVENKDGFSGKFEKHFYSFN